MRPGAEGKATSGLRVVLVLLCLALAGLRGPGVVWPERLEWGLYDAVTRHLLPPLEPSGAVVVATLDDRALSDLGARWPLSRDVWADFIEVASSYGAEVIGLDAIFDQPGAPLAPVQLQRLEARIEKLGLDAPEHERLAADLRGVIDRGRFEDGRLIEALAASGRVVLGAYYDVGIELGAGDAPVTESLGRAPKGTATAQARAEVAALAPMRLSSRGSGALNVLLGADGVVRRYPYLLQLDEALYPSLAIAVAHAGGETRDLDLLDWDAGAPLLRFPADGRMPLLSFSDLLLTPRGSPALRQALEGRYLLVGVTTAASREWVGVPTGGVRPGVEIHAIALENFLSGAMLRTRGLAAVAGGLWTVLLLALFWILARRTRAIARIHAWSLAALALNLAVMVLLARGPGWVIGLVPGVLGILGLHALEVAVRFSRGVRLRRDLEAQRRLDKVRLRAEQRMRSIVENVADAIFTVDSSGIITSNNPAAAQLFGESDEALHRRPVRDLIPRWDAETLRPGRTVELMAHRREGGEFPIEVAVGLMPGRLGHEVFEDEVEAGGLAGARLEADAPIMSDMGRKVSVLVCVARDITERRAMERMKDEFVAMVSHELRTPMTSIKGSLGLVLGGALGEIPSEAERMLTIAQDNSERLVRLVTDILDLAKLEAGHMEFELIECDLVALCEKAMGANRGFAETYAVRFELLEVEPHGSPPPRVFGDEDRLMQVLTNFMSNAVKFSPDGGRVQLRLRVMGPRVRICVEDHGPGIPVAFRARIFEKFAQAEGAGRGRRKGTGLGLNIARSIAEQHDGTVGFETELGRGTTFYLELPILHSGGPSELAAPEVSQASPETV